MPSDSAVWPQANHRILTVDDDLAISELLRSEFELAGYKVWSASSGQEALEILETRGLPHLAVIDIMMPGMTGIELCARIQEFIDLPIIMLTGVSDTRTVVDTIRRLAEDYIVKPFEPAEVIVRVERLLRRIGDFSYAQEPRARIDDRLEIEFARQTAWVSGQPVVLTPTENKLLYILMRNAGHTMLTGFLLRRLWPNEDVYEDTLRTHVYRLRKKIEASPRKPHYILTRRGFGYLFPKLS
ncbi:MAG: response regulator transcription factor [Acidobacteriota bacterium]